MEQQADEAGVPAEVFTNAGLGVGATFYPRFDVWPDGQSFVLVEPLEAPDTDSDEPLRIHVVENWISEFAE